MGAAQNYVRIVTSTVQCAMCRHFHHTNEFDKWFSGGPSIFHIACTWFVYGCRTSCRLRKTTDLTVIVRSNRYLERMKNREEKMKPYANEISSEKNARAKCTRTHLFLCFSVFFSLSSSFRFDWNLQTSKCNICRLGSFVFGWLFGCICWMPAARIGFHVHVGLSVWERGRCVVLF